MKVLVTGGAGYIGSHTVVELAAAGHTVVVVDNLCNSHREVTARLKKITGQDIAVHEFDLRDAAALTKLMRAEKFDAVIHFAGLKAVGESVADPLRYYDNNLGSTISLLAAMKAHGPKRLIFSSSATVYGEPQKLPITEDFPVQPINPYGQTKAWIDQMLQDLAPTDDWQLVSLRYFNPIGAHESGLIGEDPQGTPNNLLPFVAQVAVGRRKEVQVFGDDYDTPDGTGVRDYIHVVDLARGHVAALDHLPATGTWEAYNLGTGHGQSVLEVIQAFIQASGQEVPYQVVSRRPGDAASVYADVSKANKQLDWQAEKTLAEACSDAWRWQSHNPNGYSSKPLG